MDGCVSTEAYGWLHPGPVTALTLSQHSCTYSIANIRSLLNLTRRRCPDGGENKQTPHSQQAQIHGCDATVVTTAPPRHPKTRMVS